MALQAFADDAASPETKHETLSALFERHGSTFPELFKFCCVRNPWDRMVSFYCFMRQFMADEIAEGRSVRDFRHFLTELERGAPWLEHRHSVRPQSAFITSRDGSLLVDRVARFEMLQRDFATICVRLGIVAPLGWEKRTRRTHYSCYYDDWSKKMVASRFSLDIELFGYTFRRG